MKAGRLVKDIPQPLMVALASSGYRPIGRAIGYALLDQVRHQGVARWSNARALMPFLARPL